MLCSLLKLLPEKTVYAHCDVPCGIYDAHNAQLAAHTIIRMTHFLGEIKRDDETKAEHDIARVTRVKEEHSDILEAELMTLKNDYFKDEIKEKYPEVEELFKKCVTLGTKARVGIDMESANELLENVMKIAEIFYRSKGLEPFRTKSPYPTELEIVLHK
jgi:nickel superoxide dismutase